VISSVLDEEGPDSGSAEHEFVIQLLSERSQRASVGGRHAETRIALLRLKIVGPGPDSRTHEVVRTSNFEDVF
jgi:hypothetical protein